MKRMDIENLDIYNASMDVGEEIWGLVIKWNSSAKRAFGYQLIRSTDSIAANISEGYGRFFIEKQMDKK